MKKHHKLDYNRSTIFGKTTQGDEKNLAERKWPPNKEIEDLCPVRLFKKTKAKRTSIVKTNRLFLTTSKHWKATNVWYKNCPVG